MTRLHRVDVKSIIADPVQRKKLMVPVIVATQAREGITTTPEQYERVQAERQLAAAARAA